MNTPTSFLHLPAEIRLIIYEMALIRSAPLQINSIVTQPNCGPAVFNLEATTQERQIRDEAMAMYYSKNDFIYRVYNSSNIIDCGPSTLSKKYDFDGLVQWLQNLGKDNRKSLKIIELAFVSAPDSEQITGVVKQLLASKGVEVANGVFKITSRRAYGTHIRKDWFQEVKICRWSIVDY